jgi:hypothetical protein
MEIWSVEGDPTIECRKGETTRRISEIFERRHCLRLSEQKCRGQSFKTFKNSPTSNFYIGNCKAPASDALVRFSIRARNDILWTPAKKMTIFKNQFSSANCGCGNKRFCNLLHILNNCNYNMGYMTDRHNPVQGRLVEAIMKHRNLQYDEIAQNKMIRFNDFEELANVNLSTFSSLRPDVYFWSREDKEGITLWKLFIIKLCIPFGRGTEDQYESTLKYINRFKMVKYKGLMDRLNSQLKNIKKDKTKFKAEMRTVVVFSLGAIPNFTIMNLSAILNCKCRTIIQLWSKRMAMAALKGSFILWLRGGSTMANQMQGKR